MRSAPPWPLGHSILVIIYYLLLNPERRYTDLGADYFLRRDSKRAVSRYAKQLMAMGYEVTLTSPAA